MAGQPRLDLQPAVSEPVVLLISRREVEAADIASMLSRPKPFVATREEAWRYRGQMTLVVDGYSHDPRELVDIPEVRTLLRSLEASWPHWAYSFNQVDGSITLLLSCVAGSRFPGRGAVEMDAELVAAALGCAFGGMDWRLKRLWMRWSLATSVLHGFMAHPAVPGRAIALRVSPHSGFRPLRNTAKPALPADLTTAARPVPRDRGPFVSFALRVNEGAA